MGKGVVEYRDDRTAAYKRRQENTGEAGNHVAKVKICMHENQYHRNKAPHQLLPIPLFLPAIVLLVFRPLEEEA